MAKSDTTCSNFQTIVQENLVRHYSILDLVSKFQESNARVNRAIFRAVTDCGCIEIRSTKQTLPSDCSFAEIKQYLKSHVEGNLCENCREIVEAEMGQNIFYLTGICNALGLNLEEVIAKEGKRVETLGMFHLR